jgi:hypothetical protein
VRKSRSISRLLLVAGLAVAAALATAAYFWREPRDALPTELENALFLRNLPANRWVRYHAESPGAWHRQGHAGIAFDSRRGSLLVFGSDDHGEDWDNAVHEFHPLRRRWETHYAAADPDTYRADAEGRAVAGAREPVPWAMHTYDNIEYHPRLDALVVTSRPEHNPKVRSVPGVKDHPTWLYELETRRWRPFPNGGKPAPRFFGASSAYDERRGVLVAYQGGVWEMDLGAGEWRRATAESHHDMHHTMAYDARRRKLYVFGDYRATNTVWSYTPGAKAGEGGTWEMHEPTGDPCPPYGAVPVAFDGEEGVFVLVVDNPEAGSAARSRARSASTYIYDPGANRYTKLPDGDLEPVGMNFMMVWDRNLRVTFQVTGERSGTVTVWAIKVRR